MPFHSARRTFGQLQATCVQTGSSPKIPVILCHGYGAPGDDLVGLAEPIASWLEESADQFCFIFPEAPLSPPELAAYGGRAWWAINMSRLLEASQTGTFSELHELEPPGIDRATEQFVGCLKAIFKEMEFSGPYVLGGFSQGAMVTMNTTLRGDIRPPSLLVQFSGTMVCRPIWQKALEEGRLASTSVLQSHGRLDTILPFSSAEGLATMLKAAQVKHQFVAFNGPHTIPMEAMMQLAVECKRLAAENP